MEALDIFALFAGDDGESDIIPTLGKLVEGFLTPNNLKEQLKVKKNYVKAMRELKASIDNNNNIQQERNNLLRKLVFSKTNLVEEEEKEKENYVKDIKALKTSIDNSNNIQQERNNLLRKLVLSRTNRVEEEEGEDKENYAKHVKELKASINNSNNIQGEGNNLLRKLVLSKTNRVEEERRTGGPWTYHYVYHSREYATVISSEDRSSSYLNSNPYWFEQEM